jgi:hypothetical protein
MKQLLNMKGNIMATIILKAGKFVQAGTIILQALSLIVAITETVTSKAKDSRQTVGDDGPEDEQDQ